MPSFRKSESGPSPAFRSGLQLSTQIYTPPSIGTINPPSRPHTGLSTVCSGALVTLDILKESSDWLGPLKSATAGLSAVITHCQRCISNKKDTERILRRIESLENSFATQPQDRRELERRQSFVTKLGPISANLEQIRQQGRILGFIKNVDQAQKISSAIEDIREAIMDYQTSLQQDIHNRNCQLMESADLVLLDKLPHAKGAGYLSGDGKKCMAGTRVEVLQEIESWAEDPRNHRVYWLNGVAGGGKSAIARTLAERMFAAGDLGGSFFCSRDFTERSDLHLIFPTLAHDLAHRHPNFRDCLLQVIKSNPNVGHESLSNQLEKLLVNPLKGTGLATMIIIDALDECKEPDDQPASVILSLLARHIKDIPSVKFFITGRPEPRIRTGFRLPLLQPHTEVLLLHEVDQVSVDRDIDIFLRDGLSELLTARSDMNDAVPWPGDEDVATLVRKSGGLFIYADTMLRFIASNHEPPELCLRLITNKPESSACEGPLRIDPLYAQVLEVAYTNVGSRSSEVLGQFRDIVGTIMLLFNPLSRISLASLLDIPSASIYTSLRPLHSVLLVPSANSTPIRVFHKSFPDYITDISRCQDVKFHVDPMIQHSTIAILCFELMQKRLKKNICNLPQYAMNSDVEDLPKRRSDCIGDAIEYACLFWAKHLNSASKVNGNDLRHMLTLLGHFFNELLLYWLEVLSIMGRLRDAVYILHDLRVWLAKMNVSESSLLDWTVDAERFILFFFDLIEISAPHIYASALPWSPTSSLVRNQYGTCIAAGMQVNGVDLSWNACVRSIEVGSMNGVAVSYKGDLIAANTQHEILLFEAATGVRSATLGCDRCTATAFSFDDTLLVSAMCEGAIALWDLQTGSLVRRFDPWGVVISCCVFSPSGLFVASGDLKGDIQIWNIQSGAYDCVLRGHLEEVTTIRWCPNGILFSGSDDGTIRIWDVSHRTCSRAIYYESGGVVNTAFSSDCSTAACALSTDSVEILNMHTGGLIGSVRNEYYVVAAGLSPKGDQVVLAGLDFMVLWDLTQDSQALICSAPYSTAVAFLPDGSSFVSDSGDSVKIWSTRGRDQYTDTDHYNMAEVYLIFIADGWLAASYCGDNTAKIWDVRMGSCVQELLGKDISSAEELPNRSLLSTTYTSMDNSKFVRECDCRIWFSGIEDPSGGKPEVCYYIYRGHTVFAIGGQWVALYGKYDHIVKVWDGVTGSYMHTFDCPSCIVDVESSPDSSHLACSYDGGLRMWNIITGRQVIDVWSEFDIRSINTSATSLTFPRPDISSFHVSAIPSFRFSPSGNRIVAWAHLPEIDWSRWPTVQPSALNPGSNILLYDASTGCLLAKQIVEYQVESVSFSTDEAGLQITDVWGTTTELDTPSILPAGLLTKSLSPIPRSVLSHCEHTLSRPPPQFVLSDDGAWISDKAGRKVCWVPPIVRGGPRDCCGNQFILAPQRGRAAILDFSNVALHQENDVNVCSATECSIAS